MSRWRIALIAPRYGPEILGGAETAFRKLAEQLVAAHVAEVEVLTTCARDHLAWRNALPAGATRINGVRVERFPIAPRDAARYDALHLRLMHGHALAPDEQFEFIEQSAHSPAMYAAIEKRGAAFDFLICGPYQFGITHYGSAIHPARSILWPSLHDEIYARLIPVGEMYRACRGVMFNSPAEARLARRLYGAHPGAQVVGECVEARQADPARFRVRYHLDAPFVLYAGRFERGKNVALLVDYFLEHKRAHPSALKLVLLGWGPEKIRAHADVVNLGWVDEQTKWDAYAAATVLCQPSVNESFSLTMMEAWATGTPALLHADCEVTREHALASNGGLYFRDQAEFSGALALLVDDENLRDRLGARGKAYVQIKYSSSAVIARFECALEQWAAR